MNISHLNIGIVHSLVGKNDGVSIVIDQTVKAMVKYMDIDLGHIHFLAAHTSPRFNAETDDVFWHKNGIHKRVLDNYSNPVVSTLDNEIHQYALYAKKIITRFIESNSIDLLIAHNTSHPLNFITAVAIGYYFEELREQGIIWPKLLVWWHDSYFERERFKNPSPVIKKYLKYLPGTYVDGIAFINNTQPSLAKRLFKQYNRAKLDLFFKDRITVVPNTSEIEWDWKNVNWESDDLVFPPQDNYNNSFFRDINLISSINRKGFTLKDAVILLQHTRVVPRKKIELAIDFAFMLEKRFLEDGRKKCVVVLVSGHSGDEQAGYERFLHTYFDQRMKAEPGSNVVLVFGEDRILSHRDIIVDKKYYKFAEIPSIISAYGGLGTFFSEVEGYGNNLLEMISFGLPVVINKYDVYKEEIEHLGFQLPAIENGLITDQVVEQAYELLTNMKKRKEVMLHNLNTLHEKLDHKIIAEKLSPLINKMFTRIL
ncbi:MAG: glycosyltransferase [Bacteroidota bacterium]